MAATVSMYVGDLHPDVTDGKLLEAFGGFENLSSVRVCRDSTTGQSFCYVNFVSQLDAALVMERKNNSVLNGNVMRVTWSHRYPDARKSDVGNLFVKNLNESIDNAGLQELFKDFGNILSCKVALLEDGKSKGHGFVQYESQESANAALEALNGSTIGDKQIYVGKFLKRSDRVLLVQDAKYTNLYVKNFDPDLTEEFLREKFSAFGNIVSLVIAKDDNGMSKGFGFVNFDSPDDAKQAMEAMHGTQLGSKVLYVARAQKKAEREQVLRRQFEEKRKEQILKYKGSNVYVKNIDDEVTDEELGEHFRTCGTITSAKLMRDEKGISKGFGFMCFTSPEEANKAVSTFHGYMFHRKPLYVAIAQRKEDRQAHLQMLYSQRMAAMPGPSTTVIPNAYPPFYYAAPSGVVPHGPPQPGMIPYQPMGLRPEWRPNAFAPAARPAFQPPPLPFIPNIPRRPNRGNINGNMLHPVASSRYSNNLQAKYAPNGRPQEMNKGPIVSPKGAEMLNSCTLAVAPPEQQTQMLGERLYPFVQNHKGLVKSHKGGTDSNKRKGKEITTETDNSIKRVESSGRGQNHGKEEGSGHGREGDDEGDEGDGEDRDGEDMEVGPILPPDILEEVAYFDLVFTYIRKGMVSPHGLWPAGKNGQSISLHNEDKDEVRRVQKGTSVKYADEWFSFVPPTDEDKLLSNMNTHWPNKKNMNWNNFDLWEDQWKGHGMFSRMRCTQYFKATVEMIKDCQEKVQAAFTSLKKKFDTKEIPVKDLYDLLKENVTNGFRPRISTIKEDKGLRRVLVKDVYFRFKADLKTRDHALEREGDMGTREEYFWI